MATLGKSHVDSEVADSPCSNNGENRDHLSSTITSSHSSNQDDHPEVNRASTVPLNEIVGVLDKGRLSSASECSVEVDLEAGVQETKVHLSKTEQDCRICHLSLDATNLESGLPIELGCSCKDDLAAAHKQCAEAWFKIKGDKICEICGSIARNVAGATEADLTEQWNEADDGAGAVAVPTPPESRNFWQGHRFLNFLLACMVFAFVISWLFHFNVPS